MARGLMDPGNLATCSVLYDSLVVSGMRPAKSAAVTISINKSISQKRIRVTNVMSVTARLLLQC